MRKCFKGWIGAAALAAMFIGTAGLYVHGADRTGAESPSLEGRPAPDFTLATLDGQSVKLSNLKGKIVVLDFWATWCVPCRKVMPIVDKVARQFADQGVVLYANNLREPPERVRRFTEEERITVNVLLDSEGRADREYKVTAIPRIVLIDRAGVVAMIHQQIPAELEQVFTDELKQMIQDIPAP